MMMKSQGLSLKLSCQILLSVCGVLTLNACTHDTVSLTSADHANPNRAVASDYLTPQPPQGLQGADEAAFNHLAEGSEVFPYEWLTALRSISSPMPNKKDNYHFLDHLDQKFDFIPDGNHLPYLMPFVGLTATWSNHPMDKSDAFYSERSEKFRVINHTKSIKMVGVNCAGCHTGEIRFQGMRTQLDGAPNLVDIRGFFLDMGKSTISLFVKRDQMVEFLKEQHVPNAEARAEELRAYFFKEFDDATGLFGGPGKIKHYLRTGFYGSIGKILGLDNGEVGSFITIGEAKLSHAQRLHRGQVAIGNSLEKLLRVTYGFSDQDDIGDLKPRMQFLGVLFSGNAPEMKETNAGFGRTDAFGRISNLALRGNHPQDNTAPVSLPFIWALKYTALLHYTANSNSVTMRNVGESIGLGSIVLDDQGDSTTNMYNLERLERLAYKIKVPEWEGIFKNEAPVNYYSAKQGKVIYEQNCASCHTASEKVGPEHVMNLYKMIPLVELGTDPMVAKNIVQPVGTTPFKDSIFNTMKLIKERYYEQNHVSKQDQEIWEARDTRGPEFFRDTYLGENAAEKHGVDYGDIQKGMGYRARHLAGIWATAPFLHNGSVPSIADLLKTGSDRPKFFTVGDREYDVQNMGYVTDRTLKKCGKDDDRCFDTTQIGNSNLGHEYGTGLEEHDKRDLMEYLKVLHPEPEYSWEHEAQSN
jgi:hypothetical protein